MKRESVAEHARRTAKADNKNGNPVALTSKILAIHAHPLDQEAVYIAEAAGTARRVVLEVCAPLLLFRCCSLLIRITDRRQIHHLHRRHCTADMPYLIDIFGR